MVRYIHELKETNVSRKQFFCLLVEGSPIDDLMTTLFWVFNGLNISLKSMEFQ